jgi:hypothetical protein
MPCVDAYFRIDFALINLWTFSVASWAGLLQFMQRVMQETSFGCLLPHFLQFGEHLHLEVV